MKLIFKGIVQGVGFRPTVYRIAKQLSLNGYVLNKGSEVEVVIDKNKDEFKSLIEKLRNEFVHGTYPNLDQAESFTGLYSDALTALRNQLTHGDFKQVIGSLSALSSNVTANIGSLSDFREQLRKEKKWAQADMIRSKLDEVGIVLEDTPQGTVWKRRR